MARCSTTHPETSETCILPGSHVDHVTSTGILWTDEEAVAEIRAKHKPKVRGTKKESQDQAKELASRLNLDRPLDD